jgi:hypothetical protein
VALVVLHRPTQLAPHPRAALDAGHGSKVADITAGAHDRPSTNCFFVLRGRKRLPGLCKRSAGGAACPSLSRSFGSTHLGLRQMTFVLVGGGPTGVELAASMPQMVAVAAWQFSTHQSGEKHHHPARRRQSRSSELR